MAVLSKRVRDAKPLETKTLVSRGKLAASAEKALAGMLYCITRHTLLTGPIDLPPISKQRPVAQLAHGLERVLFK